MPKKLESPAENESGLYGDKYYKVINQLLKHFLSDSLQIPIEVHGTRLDAVIDTGAELNTISPAFIEKLPNAKEFKEMPLKHKKVQTANGEIVRVLKCVYIPVKINNKVTNILFHVIPNTSLLLGLPALKKLRVKIDFEENNVTIQINRVQVGNSRVKGKLGYVLHNIDKFSLKPRQSKFVDFRVTDRNSRKLEQQCIYVEPVKKNVNLIASVTTVADNIATILVSNDTDKKVALKRGCCVGVGRKISKADENEFTLESHKTNFVEIPLNIKSNTTQYAPRSFGKRKTSKINRIEVTNEFDNDDCFELEGLDLGIKARPVPNVEEIIEKELEKGLDEELRKKLTEMLIQNERCIAKYFFDSGTIKDHTGKAIEIDIPLKHCIPKNTKSYRLSDKQLDLIDEIMSHLVYNGLAENVPAHEAYGAPVFLVERPNQTQARPPRLVIDLRIQNKAVLAPIGTASEAIPDIVTRISKNAKFITCLDLKNAYFSLKVNKRTLESGFCNLYTSRRCVRLLRAPTGGNVIPGFYRKILTDELNKNEKGEYDPLFDNVHSFFICYFDDLILFNNTTKEEHLKLLEELLKRLCRIDVRINLAKAEFVKDLSKTEVKVLGFIIQQKKILPDKKKIQCILDMQSPKNQRDIQVVLGHLCFLRTMLPLRAMNCMAQFSHLASNKVEFEWTDDCENAFQEIKEILVSEHVYVYTPPENSIKICYVDSSCRLYASTMYALDIQKHAMEKIGEQEIPSGFEQASLLQQPSEIRRNLAQHGILDIIWIGTEYAEMTAKEAFFTGLTVLYNVHNKGHEMDSSEHLEHFILFQIDYKITAILNLFDRDKVKYDQFLDSISKGFSTDNFEEYFEVILHIVAICLQINIGLIFGQAGRTNKRLFYCINSDFKTAPYLFGIENEKVFPLINTSKIEADGFQFPSSLDIFLSINSNPQDVHNYFLKVMKDDSLAKTVKICGHFAKSIPLNERSRCIFELEAKACFLGLSNFAQIIAESPLVITLMDSRVAYFLYSRESQLSNVKAARLALKLSMTFPNVRLLTVSSKQNQADMLSRLGCDKYEFAMQSLNMIGFRGEKLAEEAGKLHTWSQIQEACKKNPEAILFSEKKMDKKRLDEEYIRQSQQNATGEVACVRRIRDVTKAISIFDKYINREEVVIQQHQEFAENIKVAQLNNLPMDSGLQLINDILTFEGKIVLPTGMYILVALREHWYTGHAGTQVMLKTIKALYHLIEVTAMTDIIKIVRQACIGCLVTSQLLGRKVPDGMFPIRNGSQTFVMIDLIEGITSNADDSILTIIDVYSGYITTYVLNEKNSKNIIAALTNYIAVHGPIIKYLASDNAAVFRSTEFKTFLDTFNIFLVSSTPFRSQARGVVENANKKLQHTIMKLSKDTASKDWRTLVAIATFLLNQKRFHGGADLNPHQMQFSTMEDKMIPFRKDVKVLENAKGVSEVRQELERKAQDFQKLKLNTEKVLNNTKLARQEKTNAIRKDHEYQVNDYCLVQDRSNFLGRRKKFQPHYMDIPFKVTGVGKRYLYLENVITGQEIRRDVSDIKPIRINTPNPIQGLPREVVRQLQLVTLPDLLEGFKDIYDKPNTGFRVTREIARKLREKARMRLQLDPDEVLDRFVVDSLEIDDEFYDVADVENRVAFNE